MDYLHPVEALIPGARGRVLGALSQNTSEQSLRQVALSARVSTSRVGQVVDDLAALGIVERRETPGSVLVRLVRENVATMVVRHLSDLHLTVIEEIRQAAASIKPSPLSLTVFGSFARGQATRDSDVDVFALRPPEVVDLEDDWIDTLGLWADRARRITGNPVHLIELELEDLDRETASWLRGAMRDGVLLVGQPAQELVHRGRP